VNATLQGPGPWCAACGASLTLGSDGFLTGCEHTGKRNLSWEQQREARRRAAEAGHPAGRALAPRHPEPQVRARVASELEIPSAARTFMRAAIKAGWKVTPTYARGTALGGQRVVESLALRMSRGRERAVACWETDPDAGKSKADAVWLISPVLRSLGVADLKAYVVRADDTQTLDDVLAQLAPAKEARAAKAAATRAKNQQKGQAA
jgi:predicted  nucleic acid-binding Zn-ribbon protein